MCKRKLLHFSWMLLLSVASPAVAAVLRLNNGDRITAQILSSDGPLLIVRTELFGEVRIPREVIAELDSPEPLVVTLADGRIFEGSVRQDSRQVHIRTQDQQVTASASLVSALRTRQAQSSWEREQLRLTNPPFLDFWAVRATLALALTRGNSRTSTWNTNLNLTRTTGFDKLSLYWSQIYATQSTTPPFGKTTNRTSGGGRYDRSFSERGFAFATMDFDYDEFLDLDLRSVLGGGLGLHLLRKEGHRWELGSGFTWNREAFGSGTIRNSGELLLTQQSEHTFNGLFRVRQKLQAYPNLNQGGDYRLNFEGGLEIRLNRHLDLNLTLVDRFLSNPLSGKRHNDAILTTGIGLRFAQQ